MDDREKRSALERAKAKAADWQARRDYYADVRRQEEIETLYFHVAPPDLIRMWENETTPEGKPLKGYEWIALASAWLYAFGELPPDADDEGSSSSSQPQAAVVEVVANDTMLDFREVIRLVGMSESTIKRRWADGSFPRPIKISKRRMGWPAAEVKDWIASRAEQR